MNNVILLGRLVRDVDCRYTQTGKVVVQFTLAVDKYSNGEKGADFITCVAWEKLAETIGNNVAKGDRLLVQGSISTRSYEDKNGQKRSITEVVAQRMEFIEKKDKNAPTGNSANESGGFGSMGQEVSFNQEIPF